MKTEKKKKNKIYKKPFKSMDRNILQEQKLF